MKYIVQIAAIAAMGFGAWMIYKRDVYKQYKWGAWIIIFALGVLLAGNINVGSVLSVSDAFKYERQIQALSNQLQTVTVQLAQTTVITNQINNTIQNVVEVRKEVADVRQLVVELFERKRAEIVRPSQTNDYYIHTKQDSAFIVILRLQHRPVAKSVVVTAVHSDGTQMPLLPSSMHNFQNLLTVNWGIGTDASNFWYSVEYLTETSEKDSKVYTEIDVRDGVLWLDGNTRVKLN